MRADARAAAGPLQLPLRSLLLALLALLFSGCGDGDRTPRASALLVTFDTTRADMLSPYGAPQQLTPHVYALAQEGLVFEDASTVAPLTLPSHASMLTGLYPPRHGLRENGIAALPAEAETLAEVASAAGYQTGAFVAALVLDASFGLDQGFDVYQGPATQDGSETSHTAELRGDVVVDRALAWLRARDPERPFFLWVHLFDPHGPYDPPAAYRPQNTTNPLGYYVGEIGFADAQLGRLLDGLRGEQLLDTTYVAFTADHGEAFGEHGEPTHGAYVWDTTMRVPLILRAPDGARAGERASGTVGVTDLYPTLLDALDLPRSTRIDGRSLLPVLRGEGDAPGEGVYFESYSGFLSYGWSHLSGWRDGAGKYVHSSRPQLFEPRRDAAEEVDLLAGSDPDALRERLRPYYQHLSALGDAPALASAELAADEDLLEGIRGLGYTGLGGPSSTLPRPLAPSERPAPQDNVDVYRAGLAAQEAMNRGQNAEAERMFRELVRRQPENPFLLDRFTSVLLRVDKSEEALPHLERLVRIGPGWAGSYCNLGLAYERVGRIDDAVANLLLALQRDGDEPFFWDQLLRVLEANGRTDELARWRKQRDEALGTNG